MSGRLWSAFIFETHDCGNQQTAGRPKVDPDFSARGWATQARRYAIWSGVPREAAMPLHILPSQNITQGRRWSSTLRRSGSTECRQLCHNHLSIGTDGL